MTKVEPTRALPPTASSADKLKYELCKQFVVYLRKHEMTQAIIRFASINWRVREQKKKFCTRKKWKRGNGTLTVVTIKEKIVPSPCLLSYREHSAAFPQIII